MLVRALQGLADSARLESAPNRNSGQASSTCARTSSTSPRRPARACRLIGLGSLSSDRSTSTSSRRFRGCPGLGDADRRDSTMFQEARGANQAVAAARLGAEARFVGAVGDDDFGEPATAALRAESVDLSGLQRIATPTGIALILVDEGGEPDRRRGPTTRSTRRESTWVSRMRSSASSRSVTTRSRRPSSVGGLLLPERRAGAAGLERRPRAGRSDRRQHARARGARVPTGFFAPPRSAPRRASARGRRGGRARGAAVGRGRMGRGRGRRLHRVPRRLAARGSRSAEALERGARPGRWRRPDAVRSLRSPRPQRLTRYWPRGASLDFRSLPSGNHSSLTSPLTQ